MDYSPEPNRHIQNTIIQLFRYVILEFMAQSHQLSSVFPNVLLLM